MLHHVFLPPKLPQKDDNGDSRVDRDVTLCRFAYKASHEFATYLSQSQQENWSIVSQMLKTLKTSRVLDEGVLDKDVLTHDILCLGEGG